jgi:IS5 family transposase
MHSLAAMWHRIQSELFPYLEETFPDPLTEKQRQLSAILEIVRLEERVPVGSRRWTGRPLCDRRAIARAFVAKSVYDVPTTEGLVEMLRTQPSLRRICGFERRKDVPSKATFSRAFREFATSGLCDATHEALVRTYIGEQIVCHISRDATAVEAREKPARKEKAPPKKRLGRGRPKKGEYREAKEPTRLERQIGQSVEEALSELSTLCDVGAKKNAKGKLEYWVGYKAHIDTADYGLPVNVVTTSASVHDSQVAIPMARRTAERVSVLYELMDAAYDTQFIRAVCQSLSHRPIIDRNRRTGNPIPFDPATVERYKEPVRAERANGRLKDEFGLRHVRVRGHVKVHAHIMFGILALFADQLMKMAACQRC